MTGGPDDGPVPGEPGRGRPPGPQPPRLGLEPWLEAAQEHRLLLRHCAACDLFLHPARGVCSGCGGQLAWAPASGTGQIDAWTVVRRSPSGHLPAFSPEFSPPYVVARVRLSEGPVLLTNLPGAGPYRCGQPVQLAWSDRLPVFVPVAGGPSTSSAVPSSASSAPPADPPSNDPQE